MNTSELIKILKTDLDKNGDKSILIKNKGFGGYEVCTINSVDITTISTDDLYESDDHAFKSVFPTLERDEDGESEYLELKCIQITTGTSLYST